MNSCISVMPESNRGVRMAIDMHLDERIILKVVQGNYNTLECNHFVRHTSMRLRFRGRLGMDILNFNIAFISRDKKAVMSSWIVGSFILFWAAWSVFLVTSNIPSSFRIKSEVNVQDAHTKLRKCKQSTANRL